MISHVRQQMCVKCVTNTERNVYRNFILHSMPFTFTPSCLKRIKLFHTSLHPLINFSQCFQRSFSIQFRHLWTMCAEMRTSQFGIKISACEDRTEKPRPRRVTRSTGGKQWVQIQVTCILCNQHYCNFMIVRSCTCLRAQSAQRVVIVIRFDNNT